MKKQSMLNRRDFLYVSAVAAGGTMLAACGGGEATPVPGGRTTTGTTPEPGAAAVPTQAPQFPTEDPGDLVVPTEIDASATEVQERPTSFKESPRLAPLVEQGNLPPVEERLPKTPYVVPHKWVQPGKYGGNARMLANDAWGMSHFMTIVHMYGSSLLRLLDDGMTVGPGLVESWETNENGSEYTLNFREGLKWSDGKPFTTADVMYWWEDMVENEEHPTSLPEVMRSGTGTAAKLRAVDDTTLMISFDAPAPLVPVRLGFPDQYMQPKHYLQQFHPTYNPRLKGKKDWVEEHDSKADRALNPDIPVMTGWKLARYREGREAVFERNPYYWCVNRNGDQLPYLDTVTWGMVQNPEVLKLRYTSGDADYAQSNLLPLWLSDIGQFRRTQARSQMEVRFWDSGSGTGSIFFLNYDYAEPKMRALIRDPRFRKAISHAFNRQRVLQSVYFNQGELTTGTYSPKAIEYNISEQGKSTYTAWRDSAIKYDPERAKQLLDEMGVVDKNGDGLREMPGGEKLLLTLDYGAPGIFEHLRKNELLAADLRAVGISSRLNPVPSASYGDQWHVGKMLTNTAWEVGDGPDHLTGPWWFVPIEIDRWAPLHGQMYMMRGTPEYEKQRDKDPYERTPPRVDPEPGSPIDRLYKLYDKAKVEPDAMRRHQAVWDIIKIHVEDGPFYMGVVANYPRFVLVRNGLLNVPTHEQTPNGGMVNTWAHPTPAVYDPESWYWDNPEAHQAQ